MVQYQAGKKTTEEVVAQLKEMWKKEKLGPFYRGFGVVMLSTVPSTAIYFLSYESGKTIIPGSDESLLKQSLAGVVAQFCSSFIFAPRDVIKERLQVQALQTGVKQYSGAWDAFKTIVKNDGFPGLYRGYFQTLSLWSIYGALYLAIYTKTKSLARQHGMYARPDALPTSVVLGCATFSASLAAAITNPLDVIKLLFQVNPETKSFSTILTDFTKEHGPRVWVRGTLSRILWMAPRTALSFTTYESVKSILGKWNNNGRRISLEG